MTDYNVWLSKAAIDGDGRWTDFSEEHGTQDIHAPYPITYVQARKILERFRETIPHLTIEVRVLNSDSTPGSEAVGYNVWMDVGRWTDTIAINGSSQDIKNPIPLTLAQAKKIGEHIGAGTIMEIGFDMSPQPLYDASASIVPNPIITIQAQPPVPQKPAFDFDVYNGLKR